MDHLNGPASDDCIVKAVVRSFSWETYANGPEDGLAHPLTLADGNRGPVSENQLPLQEQWMQLFDPLVTRTLRGQEEITLSQSTQELAKVYEEFLKCLPKEQAASIKDGPPELQTVLNAVRLAEAKRANDRRTTKTGRAKQLFSRVNIHLAKYRDLCDMIPSGDKYLSLLTGSLSAIVKATLNHEKIVESVSTAMDDLSDDIADWKLLLEGSGYSYHARQYVAQLYVEVFKFLAAIMRKWLSKSSTVRAFRSFDSGFFHGEIEEKKTRIAALHEKLERQANREMQRSVQKLPTREDWISIANQLQANFSLKMNQLERRLGNAVQEGLEKQAESLLWEQRRALSQNRIAEPDRRLEGHHEVTFIGRQYDTSPKVYNAADVRFNGSQRTHSYPAQRHILYKVSSAECPTMHIEVFDRIKRWNEAAASQTLWISGAFQVSRPSQYTRLSAHVISTAQRAAVPAVYYFCDTTTRDIDLMYCLIGQLVELLPDEFESTADFGSSRFILLNGTDSSCDHAKMLLEELLMVGPPLLFVVIDGIQWMAGDAARNLIEALRYARPNEGLPGARRIKTFYTTDGHAPALSSLSIGERLDAMDFGTGDGEPDADGIDTSFLT